MLHQYIQLCAKVLLCCVPNLHFPLSISSLYIAFLDQNQQAVKNWIYMNTIHMSTTHMNMAHMNTIHMNMIHMNMTHMNMAHMNMAHMNMAHMNMAHMNTIHMNMTHMNMAHMNMIQKKPVHATRKRRTVKMMILVKRTLTVLAAFVTRKRVKV